MKKSLLYWVVGFGITAALSSCVDPYYTTGGASYNSGYGQGYGYGSSNFSTSLFVSTGNPQWGYDPYSYSYYDYRRRCYYDPYLYGYYPIGYRPPAIYGCPHPYGWRQGSRYCPPPRTVRNVTVINYQNRESAYRNSNYHWAKQVRQAPNHYSDRNTRSHSQYQPSTRDERSGFTSSNSKPLSRSYEQPRYQNNNNRYEKNDDSYRNHKAQLPQSYQTPVTTFSSRQKPSKSNDYQTRNYSEPRTFQERTQKQPRQSPPGFEPAGNSRHSSDHSQRETKQERSTEEKSSRHEDKGLRRFGGG